MPLAKRLNICCVGFELFEILRSLASLIVTNRTFLARFLCHVAFKDSEFQHCYQWSQQKYPYCYNDRSIYITVEHTAEKELSTQRSRVLYLYVVRRRNADVFEYGSLSVKDSPNADMLTSVSVLTILYVYCTIS